MTGPFASLSVEHVSTVDRVADELRRAIFDGELESGTALREVPLAESLGVSRPTVREALGLLVVEGLATREPHRGVTVTSPDPQSVRDVCRARAVLEVAGVRNWEQADEADREEVRRALVAYTTAVSEGASYQRLNERHLAVHASLVGLLGSPRLTAFSEALASELKLALAQIDRVRRNAHDQADSHLHLVGMLERGEVEAAAERIGQHLAEAEHDIVAALGSGPPH